MKIKYRGIIVVILIGAASLGLFRLYHAQGSSNSRASILPNVSDTSKWTLAFSDDFTGDTLNPAKWSTCYDKRPANITGCTNSGNNEQEWYLPQQVSVKDGSAILTAIHRPITVQTPQASTTYPYQSGMISTGRGGSAGTVKWSATYGYFVARMKIDGGKGVWPAFWLLPADRSWPPEIDIMEHLGDKPNDVLLTTHWRDSGGPQKNSSTITGPDYSQGWHTYAVNWQPGLINWYVDGVLRKTVMGSQVPHTPMEIIFDLAIGGNLPGNANSSTPFPRTARIDYVKVYERK